MGQKKELFLRDRDLRFLWHPYTKRSSLHEGPLPIIVKAEGPFLYDISGKRYFDAISSWWCCNIGHSHPLVVQAIKSACEVLQHSILGNLTHVSAIELAERLVQLFPGKDKKVLFASDGASAVEAALKIAVQYFWNLGRPEKVRFVALKGAYHGDTLGGISVGFMEDFHRPFKDLVFPCYFAEAPSCTRCRYGQKPQRCALPCLESMAGILEKEGERVAGVIVEPLCQGASGMRIYTPRYLSELASLCNRYEVLLIVDEIATGFGRTGSMFAFEKAGIDPPLVCLGKGLTGGYLPLSATVVANFVYETFTDGASESLSDPSAVLEGKKPGPKDCTFYHGHTFSGNPIATSAALATLNVFEEEKLLQQAEEKGLYMAELFEEFRAHRYVVDVRCLGMIAAIETLLDPKSMEKIRRRLVELGYLFRPLGNVIYLMPPLTTPKELIREAAQALLHVLSDTETD